MNKNKHTPVPWRWGNCGAIVTDKPDEQVRFIGDWADDNVEIYGGHVICESATEANGRFIIRACNAHADLLAACEAALRQLRYRIVEEHLTTRLEAAIAKAKEEGA